MLPPELVRQIRLLEIRTDRAVDELVGGAYRSIFRGRGIEFDEVREYIPGADVRTIDWNVSARTGSAFVKKFVEERELTVLLIVDGSASGDYGSTVKSRRTTAAELARVKPVYEEMDGWMCETSNITRMEDLPPKAKAYVDRLVELSGGKLGILSIGPARESTLRVAL